MIALFTDSKQVRGQRHGTRGALLAWCRSHNLDKWEIHEDRCGLSPNEESLIAHDDEYWRKRERDNEHKCSACGERARYKLDGSYLCADCVLSHHWEERGRVKVRKVEKPWLTW